MTTWRPITLSALKSIYQFIIPNRQKYPRPQFTIKDVVAVHHNPTPLFPLSVFFVVAYKVKSPRVSLFSCSHGCCRRPHGDWILIKSDHSVKHLQKLVSVPWSKSGAEVDMVQPPVQSFQFSMATEGECPPNFHGADLTASLTLTILPTTSHCPIFIICAFFLHGINAILENAGLPLLRHTSDFRMDRFLTQVQHIRALNPKSPSQLMFMRYTDSCTQRRVQTPPVNHVPRPAHFNALFVKENTYDEAH
ncbi:predicted protein [Lichtheimia corymbifera JMRC:FSU:9682]|uniref:Uncharacterized protein n=1 Tax=Lichtheimia corymbifera JMRC:FSU:9682 TaxID=1263082 RepID=A0A068S5U7_9FUNG|nr:predicted protein [Lichtheimia corymbifera JMRC:FSU:9682]